MTLVLADQTDVERLRALVAELDSVLAGGRSVSLASVNPDGTPGPVAPGELIESSWGNAVVDVLSHYVHGDVAASVPISGPTDAAAGSFTNWLVVGVTVPAWAVRCVITTTVAGHFVTGTGDGLFEIMTSLGVQGGGPVAVASIGTSRASATYVDTVPVTSTGNLTLAVLARRTWGADSLRVDASSSCRFALRFLAL